MGERQSHRFNLLGLAACLLALVVAQVAFAGGSSEGTEARASASVKKQINQLKARIAALEAKPDQVGQPAPAVQIPSSLPPSGPASGELAGSYPSPTVGTVAGLDLAPATSATGGVNFGSDTNLYRTGANALRTDDALTVQGSLTTFGSASVATSMSVTGVVTAGSLVLPEVAPSTIVLPQPNQVLLFTRDNGANKTQLRAQWPTGGEVVLFTEP